MGYEKLTVEHFALNLKEGRYAGLTGARRAIGKTAGWGDADRKRAHALADKHFGTAGAATSKGKTAKKLAKKAVKKTAKPAKRAVAKAAAPKAAPKAKTAKPAKRAVPKAAAKTARRAPAQTFLKDHGTSVTGRLMQNDDPATVRQHSASTVIAAYRNAGALNVLEQRAYAIATAEYAAGASDEAIRAVDGGRSVPVPTVVPAKKQPAPKKETPTLITAPPPAAAAPLAPPSAPRIAVPGNGSETDVSLADLSPEERAQHERLKKSALAAGLPVPTPAS